MKTIPAFVTGCLVGCVFLACYYLLDTKQSPSVPTKSVTSLVPRIDIEGTLIFESQDGQCLRMWQIPHRMEAWLMLQSQKNIRIEDIYYFDHRTKCEPESLRYYIRYQVLKEKP